MPDPARRPEHLIEGDTWEFPAAECAFALEVVSGTLFTEPKAGEYSVWPIVRFGEPLAIPAGDTTVEPAAGNF